MKKSILIVSLLLLISSCVTHHGNFSSGPLLSPDYTLKQTAVGYAKSVRFLGLGGYSKNGLIRMAKENLYQTTYLGESEYFSNFSIDFKETYYPLTHKTEVFISADILKDNTAGNKTLLHNEMDINAPVALGDSVYFDLNNYTRSFIRGKVIEISETNIPNKLEVLYRDKKGRLKIKSVYTYYKKKPSFNFN